MKGERQGGRGEVQKILTHIFPCKKENFMLKFLYEKERNP